MDDTSEVEDNQNQRKPIRGRGSSWRWIVYLALFLIFGFSVIGMLWFIFVEGYEMRDQDWLMFGFDVIGTLLGIAALWEEWRMRRSNVAES
ncbi:MAG: hypothetical protein ACFFEM_04180 [Candidatus Thorarchaeota archaeon]